MTDSEKLEVIARIIDPHYSPGGDVVWLVQNYVTNVREILDGESKRIQHAKDEAYRSALDEAEVRYQDTALRSSPTPDALALVREALEEAFQALELTRKYEEETLFTRGVVIEEADEAKRARKKALAKARAALAALARAGDGGEK